jgi:hypothetical protein
MPLPEEDKVWPPLEWSLAFDQYASNDAWYAGSELDLVSLYGSAGNGTANRGDNPASHFNNRTPDAGLTRRSRIWRSLTRPFWTRSTAPGGTSGAPEQKTRLHSPLAGNLATLSSDLLFSDPPTTRLMKDGKPVDGAPQDRVDLICNSDRMRMTLSQAGEWAAGISGVVLTAHWDPENTDAPWMGIAAADAAVPEYEGEKLVAINLWSTYQTVNASGQVAKVFYHVERHERGAVIHALYEGAFASIGKRVPLDTIPETAHYLTIPNTTENPDYSLTIGTGIDVLTAAFWRNLPTRLHRKHGILSRLGRADFEGVEPILSAVDEVWSSWMRDIKIARARLIVPNSFLEGGVFGPQFDDDQEILTSLEYADTKSGETIEAHQFEIRFLEHRSTILALVAEVLQHCGYSESSYSDNADGGSKTATEVLDRTSASERTRDKKGLYFADAQVQIDEALLELDRVHYHQPGLPDGAEIVIEFAEISQIDPEKEARTLGLLRTAMAASTKTLVEMQHPEWSQDEKDEEVDRILAENNLDDTEADEPVDPTTIGRLDPSTGLPIDPTAPPADPAPAVPPGPSLADPLAVDPKAVPA